MTSFTNQFGGNNIYPVEPTFLQIVLTEDVVLSWPTEQAPTGTDVVADIMEVAPSVANLSVQFSDATGSSTGYTALFNNTGAYAFNILDGAGNQIVNVQPGTVWQLYLADNSTVYGTWRSFQYGASVSQANAATLAGAGLKAINTSLNEQMIISSQSSNYNIMNSDRASVLEWTSGNGTFTLPNAATVGANWFVVVKNNGTGVLTLNPTGLATIDGGTTKLFQPEDSAFVITDGTNWVTVGFGQTLNSIFDFTIISLAGQAGNYVLSGLQLNRVAYRFTGAPSGNVTVIVPNTIQQYWVDNETSGNFSLSFATQGNTGPTVAQGQRNILFCDGVNVYTAVTFGSTGFNDGTVALPSISFADDLDLGFYRVAEDTIGLSTNGTQRWFTNATGQTTFNTPASNSAPAITLNAILNGIGLLIQSANSMTSTAPGLEIKSTVASGFASMALIANNGVLGTNDFAIYQNGGDNSGNILNRANAPVRFGYNGNLIATLGAAANHLWFINPPAGAGTIGIQGAEAGNRAWALRSGGIGAGEFDIYDEAVAASRLYIDTTGYVWGNWAFPGTFTDPTIGGLFVIDNNSNNHMQVISFSNFLAQVPLAGLSGQVTNAQVPASAVTQYASNILANAALTGTPTAPTASPGTNSTQIATTAFVNQAISSTTGIVQSGSVAKTAAAAGSVVFSTPFPNACSAVTLAFNDGGTSDSYVQVLNSVSNTGFTYKGNKLDPDSNFNPNGTLYWIAVGN